MIRIVCALVVMNLAVIARAETGTYRVPVSPEHADFANFALPDLEVERESGGRLKLRYTLPLELTGAKNHVAFQGFTLSDGSAVFSNEYGSKMQCPSAERLQNCRVSYAGLNFDSVARDALLDALSKSDQERSSRQAVAMRFEFGGEPHGFLSVD